ncbi:MAG: CHASE3 domain-containing protein [Gemmataceae bacterium]
MKIATYDRWGLGAGALVALLVAAAVLTLHGIHELREDAFGVARTHEVMTGLENVLSLAKDAETGGRGYIITGELRYLEPYNTAVASINKQVDDVERLTNDNPLQQERFLELRSRISDVMKDLDRLIVLRKEEGFDAAQKQVLTERNKTTMDALRVVVGEMIQHEQELLRERKAKRERTYNSALITSLLSGVVAAVAVAAFVLLMRRHLAERTTAAFRLADQAE